MASEVADEPRTPPLNNRKPCLTSLFPTEIVALLSDRTPRNLDKEATSGCTLKANGFSPKVIEQPEKDLCDLTWIESGLAGRSDARNWLFQAESSLMIRFMSASRALRELTWRLICGRMAR